MLFCKIISISLIIKHTKMEKIKPDQLREIHKLLLAAISKTEALYKDLPQESLKSETLFRLSNNIESVIFNALYDANDLLFDESSPYPPITDGEIYKYVNTTFPQLQEYSK